MKAKNLNNSSRKTNRLIKNVFAEMLSEYKEISRISVSELCARAEISRGTFYSHYDDIYGVAEDYENELIDHFFDNAKLLTPTMWNSLSIFSFSTSAKTMKTINCFAAPTSLYLRQRN